MLHAYDDEDNSPMVESEIDRIMEYTVYSSRAEMKAGDEGTLDIPFSDPPEHGCWDCLLYDPSKEACTKDWNNLDESYYNPDRDDHDPTYYCSDHETDPDAEWSDWFDTDDGT